MSKYVTADQLRKVVQAVADADTDLETKLREDLAVETATDEEIDAILAEAWPETPEE